MTQWEYQITIHELPEPKSEGQRRTIECDQEGLCFIHDVFKAGLQWLEDLFREKGKEGWELVQSGYHQRQIFCIWKRRKETREKS